MSNYSKIYWFTRLDSLQNLFGVAVFMSCLILFFYFFIFFLTMRDYGEGEYRKKYSKYMKLALWILIPSAILGSLIPNKNEALLIMAGGKTLDFVQSDSSLSKIPSQTTSIISSFLEKQLKEMKSSDK